MDGCARSKGSAVGSLVSSLDRGLTLIVLVGVLLFQTAALGDVPGFRAPQLASPTNPSNFSHQTTPNGPAWSSVDDEIKELARGLKYDPGLMYKFVHDYIKFTPIWGDLKGPYMTWMDRSGGSFDQASLMIALLEEAESHNTERTIADPKYVVGKIELTAAQFDNWFKLINDSPSAARAALARAAIYAQVNEDAYGDIDTVEMVHVWVKVTIDSTPYEFDPSFKTHEQNNGQVGMYANYSSAIGYTRSSFLSEAKHDWHYGTNWVEDLNKSNIRDNLDAYTDNLVEYIQDNVSDGGLMDVIGGLTIEPAEPNDLPPSSPGYNDVLTTYGYFDKDTMPDMYRTTLRIQHEGIDYTFNSSEIYGRRLSLRYNGSDQPQLVLDGTVKDAGNTTTTGQQYDLAFTVTHPYYATDFNGTVTVKVTSGGFYSIVNGWGDTNTNIIEKHRCDLEQYRYDAYSDSSEEVLGESFAIAGLTWLAQTSKMRALAAGKQCERPWLINHHIIGITGQYGSAYIDMPLGHLGVYSEYYADEVLGTVSGHAAAYEHEVIRQLQDVSSVSTISLIEQANDDGTYGKIYSASSSQEWTDLQDNLHNYNDAEKALVSGYIDDGFTVYLPEHGDLTTENWTGMGFIAELSSGTSRARGYIISDGFSGGAATGSSDAMIPADLLDRGDVFAGEREGTYHHDSTDLTIGTGGMPFGLSLSRTYSSQRRLKDGPLGLGWTHNFDITATTRSDSFQALGADSPIDAAAHIVALHVIHDILTRDGDSLANNVIVSLIEAWLMDKMMDNLVTIEQGGAKMHFVKLPDEEDPNGFFNPPTRKQLKLVLNGGNFRLKNPRGIFNDFNSSGQLDEWSDAHGNKVDFTYSNGKLDTVACKIGGTTTSWSMSFTYNGDHVSSVSDSASRSISYGYTNGNLTTYTNPDSKTYTYDYDDANDGQLTEVFSPLDAVNPVLTNVYDSLGRLRQQKDANDYPVDYYLAGFRAETVEPNQTNPQGQTKRYSTVVWADEFGRPVSATDQLGREGTYEYDGKLRLIRSIRPDTTSMEYTYDERDYLTDANDIVKPNSTDPNLLKQYDYSAAESAAQRWFINRTKYTDPNSGETSYVYDPNTGVLTRITYPPTEAGTVVLKFRYNSYGQLLEKFDPCNVSTQYVYNGVAAGSTLQKVIVDANGTGALAITTEYTYDSVGNVASVKDPRGNTTSYQYYYARMLKKVTDPCSYAVDYEYYDDGKLHHVKQNTTEDGWIYHQTIAYNARGLKKEVKGPYKSGQDLGINRTKFEYDALGRLIKVTDAENNVTETKYYPDSKVWRVIDAEDHNNVTNTYDANGYLIKVEDAKGNATQYEYNDFGGLKKTIYADGTFTEPNYSVIRESRSIKTRAGDIIETWFDDLGRLKKKVTPDKSIKYEYDLRGRVIETYESYAAAPKARLIKYTYDDVGRVTKVEYEDGKSVQYEYDANGNRTKLTYPDASYITYEYDVLNRLKKIKNQGGSTLAQYAYNSRSRRTDLNYLNGTYIDYTYDAASRLTTIDNTTDNDSHDYDYTYDKVGNRLTMLVNATGSHSYTYDDIYQLTDVNYPAGYSFSNDTTFNYDDAGNRTSVIESGTTSYSANNLNQYDYVGSTYYDYDLNGNTMFDGVAYYSYDSENRLIGAVNAEGSTAGPLNAAVDNMELTFTRGGDANWAPIRPDANDPNIGGPDSARSGLISTSQSTYFEAVVSGTGTVKFYYKKDAGTNDAFRFRVDGSTKTSTYDSAKPWTYFGYNITAGGSHTLRWQYEKGASGNSDPTGAWVDRVEWLPSGGGSSPSIAEAVDSTLTYSTGGDSSWYGQTYTTYYGGDAASHYGIDDDQETWMQTTYTASAGDKVSFFWKVSSESSCDYLEFYIDAVRQDRISGEIDWTKKSYSLSAGSRTLKWRYVKDSSGYDGDDHGWVDGVVVGDDEPLYRPPGALAEATDCDLPFTVSGDSVWVAGSGAYDEYYLDGDSAHAGGFGTNSDACMQTIVESSSSETLKFYWKVSSQQNGDYLQFYIDETLQHQISGEVDWTLKTYSLSAGIHTLKWRYVKDGSTSSGDDTAWVDFIQWTGDSPARDPNNWQQLDFKHDVTGRRVEKKVDGYSTRYCYDGPHVIAEYDGNNNLLRKYIYGPGIDQPVSMIEVADGNAAYYYHYDALGSVIALSDSTGDTVQTYEYSVFGEPAVEDPNHTNPYMFAGRRYDIEIGLYYNRARYYNPYTGRFLQTDPIGYGDGMNLYAYCGNNPTNYVDPSGAFSYGILDLEEATEGMITVAQFNDDGSIRSTRTYSDLDNMIDNMKKKGPNDGLNVAGDYSALAGEELNSAEDTAIVYWDIITLLWLNYEDKEYKSKLNELEAFYQDTRTGVQLVPGTEPSSSPNYPGTDWYVYGSYEEMDKQPGWYYAPVWAALAHEIGHVIRDNRTDEAVAMEYENDIRYALYKKVPTFAEGKWACWPRPGYGPENEDLGQNVDEAWANYWANH